MQINYPELVNFVFAIAFSCLVFRKNISWVFAAVFAYGSLYFAHSAYLLVTGAPLNEISATHTAGLGSGMLAKIATILFLVIVYASLVCRVKKIAVLDRQVVSLFLTGIVCVAFGGVVNFRAGDGLQLQNLVGVVAMLILILLGYLGGRCEISLWQPKREFIVALNIVLAISAVIAFCEIFSERAWSGTVYSTGIRVDRASSIFFNPNLYAFWVALVYLGYSYLIQIGVGCREHILAGMLLSATGLYLSGGRSAALLLFCVLVMCGVFVREGNLKWRWAPLGIFGVFFALIYLISNAIIISGIDSHYGWQSLSVLGERVASTPVDILRYTLSKMPMGVSGGWIGEASPQIVESIEGRLIVAKSDSGFVSLYVDAGWFGLVAILGLWFVLFRWSIQAYLTERNAFGIYSLGVLFYCVFSGLSMRFQVFPVWLLIGISLVPCLIFWRKNGEKGRSSRFS